MTRRTNENWVTPDPFLLGRRVAFFGVLGSGFLAVLNITTGLMGGSTSVLATGLEFAGDVLASSMVLFGIVFAARPPDANHPYGHGRSEILAGLLVGFILLAAGFGISYYSLQEVGLEHEPPAAYGLWALLVTILLKSTMAVSKFHYGRRIQSAGLVADGWNDAVDIISALTALTALGLTILDPDRFLDADHFGGFAVGLAVVFTGLRVVRDTSLQLMDTMPDEPLMIAIRAAALGVPGTLGVEKCFARKTGLRYHVDLHLEVDPDITVDAAHRISGMVRNRICNEVPEVADVLIHVEPATTSMKAGPAA